MGLTWMEIAFPCVGYLLGAVPFGVLIARSKGVDLREVGSGNIGATNVARNLGMRWGLMVLLLDAMKGFVPTFVAGVLAAGHPRLNLLLGVTMVAAVAGHMFTVFLKFRGGKGVATALGTFFAVCPLAGLAGTVLYVGLYAATRVSSLGSLALTVCSPVVMVLRGVSREVLAAALAVAVLIVIKHIPNIRRLARGEEGKVR